jgi:hypothetical protein
MKNRLIGLILFSSLILSACAAAATVAPAQPPLPDKSGLQTSLNGSAPSSAPAISNGGPAEFTSASSQISLTQRLVIKNASLEIVVDSPTNAMESISTMAQQMQGFVVSSSSFVTKGDSGADVPQAKITVRVPADKLDEALTKIRALVKNVDTDIRNQNVTGKDVTEDYVDLNSQLTNLQATEKQLQQIMESATKTEDVLSVFNQLSNVRQQIDVTQGKIKFYEQSASLSAIDVNILAQSGIAPLQIAGWQPVGIARNAVQALIETGKFLAEVVIWLVIFFVPLGLIFFFPVRYIVRFIRRYRSRIKPAASQNLVK